MSPRRCTIAYARRTPTKSNFKVWLMAHYLETADGLDFGVVCCLHYPAAWAISKPDVKQVKKEKNAQVYPILFYWEDRVCRLASFWRPQSNFFLRIKLPSIKYGQDYIPTPTRHARNPEFHATYRMFLC